MLLLYQQYDGIYLFYNSGGYSFVLQFFQILILFLETGGTGVVPPVESDATIQAAGAVLQ